MPFIEFQNVSKSYDKGKTFAVAEVNLAVERGELLVLLGESGCGKTTTLKLVNRLVERDSGRIILGGEDIASGDPVTLRRKIGYVFQAFGLFPHMTVEVNVGVGPRLLKWSEDRVRQRTEELLMLVGLDPAEHRDRLPGELSGGQQQRVALARALATEPLTMLLDEPFGALDPMTRDALQNDFSRIRRELGLTAIMVTHDMTEALLLADRIAVMREGRVLQHGAPRELLRAPAHEYVEALLDSPRRQADALEDLANDG